MKSFSEKLSVSRMIGLSRLSFSDEWRPYIWTGLIFFVLTFFSGMTLFRLSVDFLFKLMLLAGIMFVSRTFADLKQKERGTYWLMIPASPEEKFLVRLLVTLVGFYLFAVLVHFLAAEAGNFFSYLIFDQTWPERHLTVDITDSFSGFLFFHAVFFTGSIFFRKNNFLKTALVLIGIFFILLLTAGHYLRNTVLQGRHHHQFQFYFNSEDGWQGLFDNIPSSLILFRVIVLVVIPLCLYGISYFMFKNTEIKK